MRTGLESGRKARHGGARAAPIGRGPGRIPSPPVLSFLATAANRSSRPTQRNQEEGTRNRESGSTYPKFLAPSSQFLPCRELAVGASQHQGRTRLRPSGRVLPCEGREQ